MHLSPSACTCHPVLPWTPHLAEEPASGVCCPDAGPEPNTYPTPVVNVDPRYSTDWVVATAAPSACLTTSSELYESLAVFDLLGRSP